MVLGVDRALFDAISDHLVVSAAHSNAPRALQVASRRRRALWIVWPRQHERTIAPALLDCALVDLSTRRCGFPRRRLHSAL
jgi:hypothetical protein